MASQVEVVVENLPANARVVRDPGSIPGSGRSPREGIPLHCASVKIIDVVKQANTFNMKKSFPRTKNYNMTKA